MKTVPTVGVCLLLGYSCVLGIPVLRQSQVANKCPRIIDPIDTDYFIGIPGSPAKYYQCVWGLMIQRSCLPGTSVPDDFGEGSEYPCTNAESLTTTKLPLPETTSWGTALPVPTWDPDCPEIIRPDKHYFIAYPGDRTRYYQCVFGRKVENGCPIGTCVPPEYVSGWQNPCRECLSTRPTGEPEPSTTRQPPQTSTGLPSEPTSKRPIQTTRQPVVTTKRPISTSRAPIATTRYPNPTTTTAMPTTAQPSPSCPRITNRIDTVYFIAVPGDRTKYYQCEWGRKIKRRCAPGTCLPAWYREGRDNPCVSRACPPLSERYLRAMLPDYRCPPADKSADAAFFIAEKRNRKRYYQCVGGRASIKFCASGSCVPVWYKQGWWKPCMATNCRL